MRSIYFNESSFQLLLIAKPFNEISKKLANPLQQKKLEKLLRPHWKDDYGVNEDEGKIRDSFDEALTEFQLYELAIENDY